MSYILQPHNINNGALMNQQFNRGIYGSNVEMTGGDLLGSLFGLANKLMGEILRNGPDLMGRSPIAGLDAAAHHPQVFGVSAMNVTQITRGPDGRPHIVQAHNERRMGPGGIWQTKKALRDPDRGIEKVEIGYFVGDCGEIIERRLDRGTGQYHEIQRRGITPNDHNFAPQCQVHSQVPMMQQPPSTYQPYSYYPQQQQQQQQQCPYHSQQLQQQAASPYAKQLQQQAVSPYAKQLQQQAVSPYAKQLQQQAASPYAKQPISTLPPRIQKPQQALPTPSPYSYI
ncbi:unnamed protein product [Adineta steineri]|uniref:Uncharacterized protein n=1 Tax=Adineta steineri TaxID=433720 RepID=A0A813MFZ4_9BILA|nr:unnamed protein product [Adineta steineri]CAF0891288.1 unnamed protein product [Adineta steineri]